MKASTTFAGLVLMGWTSAAAAAPAARLDLSWNGPPGCPTADQVQARVDALLGETSASSVADVRASGQVERVDSGFRLLLTMGVGDTPSSRVIEARSCEELAGAAAIAIALLARSTADDATASPSSDSAAASSASQPPAPAPAKPSPGAANSKEPTTQATPSRLRLLIDAPLGLVGWGSLPAPALGVGAGFGLRWRALRVTAGAELWRPQTHTVSGYASRFSLQSGRVEACVLQSASGFELGPCLGVAVQRLVGEGLGSRVFTARSRTTLWFSGSAGILGSLPTPGFEHLRFLGVASVLVSPSRPRFVIDQLGPVHEPALAAPRLHLGCEWIF
jgi:hypothetical protein